MGRDERLTADPQRAWYDLRVAVQNVAVGLLYHAASGKVLLHLRDVDKPPSAGKWAFFGGRAEPEDGDDLLVTWCREMREELGVTIDSSAVISLQAGSYENGARWQVFFCAWPTLDDDLVLTEGQAYGWFTFDEAYGLADLATYARDDLRLFQVWLTEH